MSTRRKGVEVLVGLFLLIGFGCIGAMVLVFGKMGTGMQRYYTVTVEFPNASGLIKGSDVLLSGAHIGHIAEPPELVAGSFRVEAKIEVKDEVKIPRAAKFLVGSSGLLGDRFVDVQLPRGFDPAETYQPGERIQGTTATGFDELTSKGATVMDQLSTELQQIQLTTARLNEGLLHERNLKNLELTFANLRDATEKFKATTQNLDVVMAKISTAVEGANTTMATANGAATDLRATIADLRKTIDAATKTVDATSVLVKKAADGGGALGTLINDHKMAEDLKSFVTNLRRSGVLFYKDRPIATGPASTSGPGAGPATAGGLRR